MRGTLGAIKIGISFLALIALSLFSAYYILPAFAYVNPANTPFGPGAQLNLTSMTDMFVTTGNSVFVVANFSCNATTRCGGNGTAYANFSSIGGSSGMLGVLRAFDAGGNGTEGFALYQFNDTVAGGYSITNFRPAIITVNYTANDTNVSVGLAATAVLVNMSTIPGCPPAGENIQLPPAVPLLNGTVVNTAFCFTNCTVNDRAQIYNSTHYSLCGPTFGPDTTNFTRVAESGNFSNVPLVIDFPGKAKINFTGGVNMSTQQQAQAIMQFAMENLMTGGRVGINDTEWNGTYNPNKPNMNLSARLTLYNISGILGITSGSPQIIKTAFGAALSAGSTCPAGYCTGISWDGQNLTFTVGGFSDFGASNDINVTLVAPANFTYAKNHTTLNNMTINFTYTPVWATSVMKNCTVYGNFSAPWAANNSNQTPLVSGVQNGIPVGISADGPYKWNVYCFDTGTGYDYDSLNFTVTFDSTKPVSSGNATKLANGTQYNPGANYGFQIDWTDTNGVSNATFQLGRPTGALTNYTSGTPPVQKSGSTYYINFTQDQLGAVGTYNYTWYANDSADNWNSSATVIYYVVQNTTNLVDLYIVNSTTNYKNQNVTITYGPGESITANATAVYVSSGTANLTRNETFISGASETAILGAGTYTYKVNMTGNANYSDNSTGSTFYLTVLQNATNLLLLYFNNGTQYLNQNITVFYGTQTNVTGLHNYSGVVPSINVYYNNGSYSLNNTLTTLPAGQNEFVLNTSGTTNYSSNEKRFWVNIIKAPTLTSLYLNGTAGNRTYNVGQPFNFTAALNITGKSVAIGGNLTTDAAAATPNAKEDTINMTAGKYNVTGYFDADANYTGSSQTYWATVFGWVNATAYKNITINYAKSGTPINIGCLVRNANTSAALVGYYVEIYNGTTNFSAGRTDSNGLYNATLTTATDASQDIKCAVYTNETNYYNVSLNGTSTLSSDFTAPSISITSPTASSTYGSTSVSFAYTASDAGSGVSSCSYTLDSGSATSSGASVSTTLTNLGNGGHTVSVTCTDAAGNSATQSVTFSISTGGSSSPSSSTGPSGTTNIIIPSIAAGASKAISITKGEHGVTEVTVTVKNSVAAVYIDVAKLPGKPATVVHEVIGKVYQYIEINKTNIKNEDINKTKIKFAVSRSWINANNISADTVALNRFTTKWDKLHTSKVNETADEIEYEAESPGLSYFAISGEVKAEAPAPEEKPKEELPPEEKPAAPVISPVIYAAVAIILIAILYFAKARKKKK